jgi:two-component system LytT family response regulator
LSESEVLRFKSKLKKWLKDKKIDEVTDDEEERLIIKDSGENIIIPVGDIMYLEACGAYSKIHTEARNFIASKTLKNIEDLLPRSFLRVHRSFIVPLERINSYTINTVCLKDGRNISLSKSGKKLLQAYL